MNITRISHHQLDKSIACKSVLVCIANFITNSLTPYGTAAERVLNKMLQHKQSTLLSDFTQTIGVVFIQAPADFCIIRLFITCLFISDDGGTQLHCVDWGSSVHHCSSLHHNSISHYPEFGCSCWDHW